MAPAKMSFPLAPPVSDSLVDIQSLSKCYSTSHTELAAVNELTLTIPRRQRVAIVGRSGSGKTTLLNLLAGLDQPTRGRITVNGHQLDQLTRSQLADYRCRQVGVVFQSYQLMPQLTALENVELPMTLAGTGRRLRRERALAALERVELSQRAAHLPSAMSGGEQQRVAIARAIVHQPALILADEPTGNLDSATAGTVERLLLETENLESTLILVTHDMALAERFGQRLITMQDGRIAADTTR